jgi:anhydro-N-acetylmuramic acid kinase
MNTQSAPLPKNTHTVLGMMSGTSLDGLDLALCRFPAGQPERFEVEIAETIEYPETLRHKLSEAHRMSALQLAFAENELTRFWAESTTRFLAGRNADFLSCSGHTVFHQPDKGLTLQTGNGAMLAAMTGNTVITDFRRGDVALGGQGAPLVPMGEPILFPAFNVWLNIGGIANVTLRDPGGRLTAFDICPANMALNDMAEKAGMRFDRGGNTARSGHLLEPLRDSLLSVERFTTNDRSSLGREWYEQRWKPLLHSAPADVLRTVTEVIAELIASAIGPNSPVLVTGGGAHNDFLMKCLNRHLPSPIQKAEDKVIDFKEAIVFAWLGVLRVEGLPNNPVFATGAEREISLGAVYRGF